MTQKKQMEILNKKMDLCLEAIALLPLFISATAQTRPKNRSRQWNTAIGEWQEIDKKYKEILISENNYYTPRVEDQIS